MLDHVSHSQLSQWLRCPRQWEYRYVKGVWVPTNGNLLLGSCYHDILEMNFRQKIESGRDYALSDWVDMFHDHWPYLVKENVPIDWGTYSPDSYRDLGVKMVAEYCRTIAPLIQPVEVEATYNTEIAGVGFTCRIDLIQDNGVVIDHKTSARRYTQDDVNKDIQASASAFVLERPITFENHVAVKSSSPKIQIVQTERTQEDIDWWVGMAARIVIQMKTGVAPPNPGGWWCGPRYCGNYEDCRGKLDGR